MQTFSLRHALIAFGIASSLLHYQSLVIVAADLQLSSIYTSPFVAAFDRFGRHEEIDMELAGQVLVTELGCASCHTTKAPSLKPKVGPRLDGVGNRFSERWLRDYLDAPHKAKPGTSMPDLMHGMRQPERDATVDALVAFLSTQQNPVAEIKAGGLVPVTFEFWKKGDAANGKKLYHSIGCVACHAADADFAIDTPAESAIDRMLEELDPEELADMGLAAAARRVRSVPLGNIAAKYTRSALAHFLVEPHRYRPASRMPNLKLLPSEAADITEYLLDDSAAESMKPNQDVALVGKGSKLFQSIGCVNCHEADLVETIPSLHATALANVTVSKDSSCLSNPSRSMPDFGLDRKQAKAIEVGLKSAFHATEVESASNQLRNTIAQSLLTMNCYACHERDGLGGVGRFRKGYFESFRRVDLGDEGRLPPSLSHVGKKLKQPWMRKVLTGARGSELRTHMKIRMPIFRHRLVDDMPKQLAKADEVVDLTESQVFGDTKHLAESGKLLMDVGCVQCHSFFGESLPGVIGIDLSDTTNRIHPSWFHDFVLNPGSLKERTRMPTFFPDGKSQNASVLDGDAELQIAAMWSYLSTIADHGIPSKIADARAKTFELSPVERPIVMRTFIKSVGTHAIVAGFPESIHYAFDSRRARLAMAWKGRFLDAQGTWFDRFAPEESPLGDSIVDIDADTPLVVRNEDSAVVADVQFLGYELDQFGVPTYQYEVGGLIVEDRVAPLQSTDDGGNDHSGLKRSLRFIGSTQSKLFFVAAEDISLKASSPTQSLSSSGLTVELKSGNAENSKRRTLGNRQQWMIPVVGNGEIILQYRWPDESGSLNE